MIHGTFGAVVALSSLAFVGPLLAQGASWQDVPNMGARAEHAIVVDPQTGEPLVFGGKTANASAGPWIWSWAGSGRGWRPVGELPTGMQAPQVIHDPVQDVFVAVGDNGLAQSWDRQGWTPLPTVPYGFGNGRVARLFFDPVRGVPAVMSVTVNPHIVELWELVGGAWVSRWNGTSGPPWGNGRVVVEPGTGRLVHVTYSYAAQAIETWQFSAGSWQQLAPPTAVTPLEHFKLVVDPASGRTMLFGGYESVNGRAVVGNEQWLFDGVDWSQVTPPAVPPARYFHAVCVDGGRVLVHGGQTFLGTGTATRAFFYDDLWSWDGASGAWSLLADRSGLPGDFVGSLAYDRERDEVVALATAPAAGTWRGSTAGAWRFWPAVAAWPSSPFALGFDPALRSVVAAAANGTWVSVQGGWVQLASAAATPTTVGAQLVSDGQVLLLVGTSGTWEFANAAWNLRAGPGPQGPVTERPGGGVVVASGGSLHGWTGSGWAVLAALPAPLRTNFLLGTDLARERVLFGGGDEFDPILGPISFFDTWEWDGAAWALIRSNGLPAVGAQGLSVGLGGAPWAVGPAGFGGATIRRWRSAAPAEWTSRGVGCAGTLGPPNLAADPGEAPWIGDSARVRLEVAGGATAGLMVLGFADDVWNGQALPLDLRGFGAPGCELFIAPGEVVALFAPLPTMADWSVAVPAQVSLVGLEFFVQGLVADPAANNGGFIVSRALRGVIGQR